MHNTCDLYNLYIVPYLRIYHYKLVIYVLRRFYAYMIHLSDNVFKMDYRAFYKVVFWI